MIYEDNMDFISLILLSKDDISQPYNISISSLEELNVLLDEGLSDIKAERVIPAEAVKKRLHEKYGI